MDFLRGKAAPPKTAPPKAGAAKARHQGKPSIGGLGYLVSLVAIPGLGGRGFCRVLGLGFRVKIRCEQ